MAQVRGQTAGGGAAAALLAIAAASPALACSLTLAPRTEPLQRGAMCSAHQQMQGANLFSLSFAQDLGGGFVRQDISRSNDCEIEQVAMIADCAARRAAVVPQPASHVMDGPSAAGQAWSALLARVAAQAAADAPLGVDAIVAEAQRAGLAGATTVRVGPRLSFQGWRFDLRCACGLDG